MRNATALLVVAVASIAPLRSVRAQSQSPASEPKFEVASLKSAEWDYSYQMQWGRNTWSSSGPKTLANLLSIAFATDHMTGLPDWNATEHYVINAKAEDGIQLTREALRPRLQQLLIERFKLVTHIETTYTDGYGLVIAKGGPKMKETTNPPAMTSLGRDRMRAPSIDMATLAKGLSGPLQPLVPKPVVNETGLTGNYDFILTYAPSDALDSPLPSIFTALQDQLGLKLEGGRKVPVTTLVVDHAERPTKD